MINMAQIPRNFSPKLFKNLITDDFFSQLLRCNVILLLVLTAGNHLSNDHTLYFKQALSLYSHDTIK